VEDASGMAVVMALADNMVKQKVKPKKTIIFIATAGHFYGSIGTRKFIEQFPKIVDKTVAAIHIEHIAMEAKENSEGKLELTGLPEPGGLFVPYNKLAVKFATDAIKRYGLMPTLLLPASGPLGEYPPTDGGDFFEAGAPVFNYISNPVYLLVDEDRIENICYERLEPTANAFYDLIRKIDGVNRTDLLKKSYPLKRLIGKIAVWKTQKKVRKNFGPGVIL
jgi:hypothetical protein